MTKSSTPTTQHLIDEATRLMVDALQLLDQLPFPGMSAALLDFAIATLAESNAHLATSTMSTAISAVPPEVGQRPH